MTLHWVQCNNSVKYYFNPFSQWILMARTMFKPLWAQWLIDYLWFCVPLKNISLIWRRHHCRWRAAKFRPMLGAQGLWAVGVKRFTAVSVLRSLKCPVRLRYKMHNFRFDTIYFYLWTEVVNFQFPIQIEIQTDPNWQKQNMSLMMTPTETLI